MCIYCENGGGGYVGHAHAIKEGRTFTSQLFISGCELLASVTDNDAGTGDMNFSIALNYGRIQFCPVCGSRLSTDG